MTNLSWTVGDVRVTRIEELVTPVEADGLLPGSGEVLVHNRDWLVPNFVDPDDQLLLSIHGLVVESAGLRILVDTCVGDRAIPGFEGLGAGSRFLDELTAAGFDRASIDVVLCTHLHFDHVGWNTMLDGDRWVPTFPQARYLFAREEYDHWKTMADGGYFASADAVTPVVDAGLVDLVETDHALTEDVYLEPTPGHTPGHVAVRIASQGAEALITGDLTHHPIQWAAPHLAMPADDDPDRAAGTRRRLLDQHLDSSLLVIGTHYAPPCAGHLVCRDDGRTIFDAQGSSGQGNDTARTLTP